MPSARGIPSCPGVPRRKERRRERLTAAPQSQRVLTNTDINKEAPQSFDWRASFLVVTPTGFDLVTEGHDAERARKSIMPRSAAT